MLPWLVETPDPPAVGARETSLARRVRDDTLALILSGQLGPGQRISEPYVASRLGVSRVPVREALRALESTGLVAARKHAGVFVRVLGPGEVAELYELRSVLDGHAGQRAAGLPAAPRQRLLTALEALLADMALHADQGRVQAYYASNLAFHWAIVDAVGNASLAGIYRGIVQQLHVSRLKNLAHDLGMRLSLDEHRAIVAAIAAGDAPRAGVLLGAHVTAAHARLLTAGPANENPNPNPNPTQATR